VPLGGLPAGVAEEARRQVEYLPPLDSGDRPAGQPGPAPAGSCRTFRSGFATRASVEPACPSCPPGLRPVLLRSDFGAGLPGPSPDGGLDEFRGLCLSRASSSAIRCPARPSSASASASSPRSETTSAASTSYGGGS